MPFDIDPQYVETPAEVKPDVFSLDGLIAWLEKQPADRDYCYRDHGRCLAAQFNGACGRKYEVPDIGAVWVLFDKKLRGWRSCCGMPEQALKDFLTAPFEEQLEQIAVGVPRTFVAALIRAKALRERQP